MLPFGLCDCHYSEMIAAIKADRKIQAIKVLKNCTQLPLKTAKGVIDMMINYHESIKTPQIESIFTMTEDMIFQDDVTSITETNGDKTSSNQLTRLYGDLYDRLSSVEKHEVNAKIQENFIRYSGQAVYDALNETFGIPNYLGYSDIVTVI